MHIYVNILGYKFPTYGLLIALGVILANLIALLYVIGKYEQDNPEDFLILEAYTFLGAFTGAKLLYIIISYKDILWSDMRNIACLNQMMQTGFVFYGGLIGGITFLYLGGKLHHLPAPAYLKHYIFLIPFIHSFGRIGCLEAGCCYGVPYSGYGAVVFPADSLAPAGIPLLPVQLDRSSMPDGTCRGDSGFAVVSILGLYDRNVSGRLWNTEVYSGVFQI